MTIKRKNLRASRRPTTMKSIENQSNIQVMGSHTNSADSELNVIRMEILERLKNERKKECMDYLQPYDFSVEIDNSVESLRFCLDGCQPCECLHFYENEIKEEEDILDDAKEAYECSSEASSAFVSLIELDEDDAMKMVEAARRNEFRKRDILALPFTDEFLTVKSLKKKQSSEDSDSIHSSMIRPKEDVDNRYARPAWITGLHDPIGLGAYEWEKLIKGIIGQGRYGRNSCREPFFRFELPSNLEVLLNSTPMNYLENYCFISERRLALYQKEFTRNREVKEGYVPGSKMYKALNNIMVNTLTKSQYAHISDLLEIKNDSKIVGKVFVAICAVTERLFFSKNLTSSSEEAFTIQRGYLERADFMNLKSKLKNANILESLKNLFYAL